MRSGLLLKMQAVTLAVGLVGGWANAADIEPDALQAMMQAGKVEEASVLLDEQLARDQKNFQLRYLKALTLLDKNQTADAVKLLNELVRDFPRVAELYNNRGVGLARLKQYSKSLQDFEEAIRLKSDYAMAQENLGLLHASLAELAFAQAMQLDPGNMRLISRHAQAQLITGEANSVLPGPAQSISAAPVSSAKAVPPPISKEAPGSEPPPLAPPLREKIVMAPIPAPDEAKAAPMDMAPPAPTAAPAELVAVTPALAADTASPRVVPVKGPMPPLLVNDALPRETPSRVPATAARPQPIPTSMLPASALSAGSPADQAVVKEAVEAWRAAWAGKNTKAYFAAYSPTFVPTGFKPFNEWRADREKKVGERTETISITMNDMAILFREDGLVDVRYSQVYRAGALEMLDRKYLLLSQKGGRWLIEQEKILVK